jgi:hypothetical protein
MARRNRAQQASARQAFQQQQRNAQRANTHAAVQARKQRNSQILAQYGTDWASGKIATGPSGETNPASVAPAPQDPAFMEYQASAGRNLAVSQLGSAYQSAQIGNEYGFGTDKSNPYSQAKLLEESWKRSKLGTTNNYASSGQLHSGAYGRMQGENDRNYSIGVDRGTRDMNNALANVSLGQLQATADYGVGLTGEGLDALLNAFRSRFGG